MDHNAGLFKLNSYEFSLVRPVCRSFQFHHNTPDTKITTRQIVADMKKAGHKIEETQLYRIIGYIRSNNLLKPYFLVSDKAGYWVTDNAADIRKFYEYMKYRAMSMLSSIKPIPGLIKIGGDSEPNLFNG